MATTQRSADLRQLRIAAESATATSGVTLPPRAQSYFQRIESYALRIRASHRVEDIVDLLDAALRETHALAEQQELRLAFDRIARAESEIEVLKAELQHATSLVQIDQLTSALNRRGLDAAFAREAARSDRHSSPLCVVVLDLDDFKQVNDRYGHQAGDDTLVHFARIVRASLRPNDVFARYGGEEFVVLLPDTDEASAFAAISRVLRAVAERPIALGSDIQTLSFSAGIARRALAEAGSAALARADAALLRAKRAGKNRVMFEAA
jgi:diguanylate cyclase